MDRALHCVSLLRCSRPNPRSQALEQSLPLPADSIVLVFSDSA